MVDCYIDTLADSSCAFNSVSYIGLVCKHGVNHKESHEATRLPRGFFSYIRLRRVILLRSDIRLMPSGIRFASFRGEYNITEAARLHYHCRLRQYHADEVGISLKTFFTPLQIHIFSYHIKRRTPLGVLLLRSNLISYNNWGRAFPRPRGRRWCRRSRYGRCRPPKRFRGTPSHR